MNKRAFSQLFTAADEPKERWDTHFYFMMDYTTKQLIPPHI